MGLYLLIGNTLYRYVKEKIKEINKINANYGVAIINDSIIYVSSNQTNLM
jgi:hypothetical protein